MKVDKTKFKALLLRNHVTQKDIANEFGVSGSVVSSWFSRGILPEQYIPILSKMLKENLVEYFDSTKETTFSVSEPRAPYGKTSPCSHFIQRIEDLENHLKDKQVIIDLLMQRAPMRQNDKKDGE